MIKGDIFFILLIDCDTAYACEAEIRSFDEGARRKDCTFLSLLSTFIVVVRLRKHLSLILRVNHKCWHKKLFLAVIVILGRRKIH